MEENYTAPSWKRKFVPPPDVMDESRLPPPGLIPFEARRSLPRAAYYEAWAWYQAMLYWIPGRIGWIMRRILYRPFFQRAGRGWHVAEFCSIQPPNLFQIGNYSAVSRFATINAQGGVILKNYSGIGPFSQVISVNHVFKKEKDTHLPYGMQPRILETKPIVIEDNVWIGAGCVILPGVRIGPNAAIMAGSTVHKDVPPYSLAGGVPARVVFRTTREELEKEPGDFILRGGLQKKHGEAATKRDEAKTGDDRDAPGSAGDAWE